MSKSLLEWIPLVSVCVCLALILDADWKASTIAILVGFCCQSVRLGWGHQ